MDEIIDVTDLGDEPLREFVEQNIEKGWITLKTARKLHICSGCGNTIKNGERFWSDTPAPFYHGPGEKNPHWLPIRVHEGCLDRPIARDLPTTIEDWAMPYDWQETGWAADTASRSYFP